MHLELDLDKIAREGVRREKENIRFRSFLKGQDSLRIDNIVHELNDEVSSQIDCTKCGNCCKSLKPSLSKGDITRLAKRLRMTPGDFKSEYAEETDELPQLRGAPCAFLHSCMCTVYEDRPVDCRGYPYLHKKDFIFRLWGVIDNYSICPIVYNVFEQLKRTMRFR